MKRIALMAGAALFLVGLAAGAPAWSAEENPEHVVRYRQMVLGSMGRHMGAISMVAKGEIPRTGDVVFHAIAMHESAKVLKDLFPASTHPSKVKRESEALPTIWDKPDDFTAALERYEGATVKLIEAAKTADLAKIQEAFEAVGGSCGNCHDTFRVDD